jgi:hypothetical protein
MVTFDRWAFATVVESPGERMRNATAGAILPCRRTEGITIRLTARSDTFGRITMKRQAKTAFELAETRE